MVKRENPLFLDLAKQLFPDKYETINYFKKNVKEEDCTDEKLNEIFECDDNVLNDNIKSYIKNYTSQSFYYKYLNKFLRQGNFEAFRILSSHLAKFIYKLYEYREKKLTKQKKSNLYRRMLLYEKDIQLYKESIGKVICYPAFTSTSLNKFGYIPADFAEDKKLVFIDIEQNNTKSAVSISEESEFKGEEEYLFLPFSFFKIINVDLREGSIEDPHIIYLKALDSDKPIEEMFVDFMEKETDNLNPEGLDLLLLENNNEKIVFNENYLSEKNEIKKEKKIIDGFEILGDFYENKNGKNNDKKENLIKINNEKKIIVNDKNNNKMKEDEDTKIKEFRDIFNFSKEDYNDEYIKNILSASNYDFNKAILIHLDNENEKMKIKKERCKDENSLNILVQEFRNYFNLSVDDYSDEKIKQVLKLKEGDFNNAFEELMSFIE